MTLIEKSFVDTRTMDARIGSQIIRRWVDMKSHANIDWVSRKMAKRSLKMKIKIKGVKKTSVKIIFI